MTRSSVSGTLKILMYSLLCLLADLRRSGCAVGMQGAVAAIRSRKTSTAEITLAEAIRRQESMAPGAGRRGSTGAAKAEPAKPKEIARKGVTVNRSIFRAYDIRGVLGETLTNDIARQIGRAVGSEARDRGLREIVDRS